MFIMIGRTKQVRRVRIVVRCAGGVDRVRDGHGEAAVAFGVVLGLGLGMVVVRVRNDHVLLVVGRLEEFGILRREAARSGFFFIVFHVKVY